MYLMIDHYDSFVYNLAAYLRELGASVRLVRYDRVSIKELPEQIRRGEWEGLILSPGPKSPSDCEISAAVVQAFAGQIPILGICLGHQIIGHCWGARITHGRRPMHGKITEIRNSQRRLFRGLPSRYSVTRYHSLVVEEQSLPACLEVDAYAQDGAIMAISHQSLPVFGIQFHPEAVLTEHGHGLLKNYIHICQDWRNAHENNRI